MSQFSPICISDSDENDFEEPKSKNRVFFVISDDEESPNNGDRSTAHKLSVKAEPSFNTPEKAPSDTNATPRKRLTLNKTRMKWLSSKIDLKDISTRSDGIADKQNEQTRNMCEEDEASQEGDDSHLFSPFLDTSIHDNGVNGTVVKSETAIDTEELPRAPTESATINSMQPGPSNFNENIKNDNIDRKSPNLDRQELFSSAKTSTSNDTQSPKSSPLKYDMTEPKRVTPKKKTPLERYNNSPRKVGAFGSPSKELKQTTLNKESFSPKKQMTSICRLDDNSSHNHPLHANQFNGYSGLQCTGKIQAFTYSQLSYLEGIEEEGHEHTSRYIDALLGLTTPYRKPPPDLCFRLLQENVLNAHSNAIAIRAYNALKRIQVLHPIVPEQMLRNVKFDFIVEVVERLELSGCECKKQFDNDMSCLKSSNALKTLNLLVDLMEKEAKRKITPYKTVAFRLVSLERNSAGVTKIISWINSCVKLCCALNIQDDYDRILVLFQRLLQLSLSVSENPDKFAENLAGDLLNCYSRLPNLECRTVFLQTLLSHLLRSKFLFLYVDIFCERAELSEIDSKLVGIQRIIQSDFCQLPLKQDDVKNFEARMCSGFHRSEEECEEQAMVITYSLQSYLFCHHKKLQTSPKKQVLDWNNFEDSEKGLNRLHLSVLDQEEIVNMGDKVQVFAGRLLSLCPALSRRTTQLVDLLSDMRMWDPW